MPNLPFPKKIQTRIEKEHKQMKITGWLANHRNWPKALQMSYARLRLAISKTDQDKEFWKVVLAHGGTLYF